jgi:hypothetical protein
VVPITFFIKIPHYDQVSNLHICHPHVACDLILYAKFEAQRKQLVDKCVEKVGALPFQKVHPPISFEEEGEGEKVVDYLREIYLLNPPNCFIITITG